MCYAIPAKINEIRGENAVVDYGGVIKEVNITLVDAKIGDYVLIHAGFAIEKLDPVAAEESLKILRNDLSQFTHEELKRPVMKDG